MLLFGLIAPGTRSSKERNMDNSGTHGLFPIYGSFDDWDSVRNNFKMEEECPEHLIIAAYDTPSYEGYALVIFYKDNKYWLTEGSHCSCHGLEGQWSPEPYETAKLLKACLDRNTYGAVETYRSEIYQAIDINEQRLKGTL